MPTSPRFLIGFGERLTEPVPPPLGGKSPQPPYTPEEARARLVPQLIEASMQASELPPLACPDNRIISILTLHPAFLAKSYFPAQLLRDAGFTSVGSRPTQLVPQQYTRSRKGKDGKRDYEVLPGDDEKPTTELFVESTRPALRRWATHLQDTNAQLATSEKDIVLIEQFRMPKPEDRLRLPEVLPEEVPLEVVLHAAGNANHGFVLEAYEAYARSLNLEVDLDRRLVTGGLCFVPTIGPSTQISALADFSFLRVVRMMPRLRIVEPFEPITRTLEDSEIVLPTQGPDDPQMHIAVFDGGVEPNSPLSPWVIPRDAPNIGSSVQEYLNHGTKVTSALLFGSINPEETPDPPYAHIDHYRVLDDQSENDPFELYDVIRRIESILDQNSYTFINLSIGPSLPIEDNEVHSWTAFLDNHLSDGRTLASVAIGNNGGNDRPSGNARIQVPGDAVNALSVGAASSIGQNWRRAPYSAFGPGRSPGVVKPDILAFGGDRNEEFVALDAHKSLVLDCGTSFAAPSALRTAVGIRCLFGEKLNPLALKALLIHTAERNVQHDSHEHGWGRVSPTIEPIVMCPDGTARVVYQGKLTPAKYLRAQLPVPMRELEGLVTIKATLVFATVVEPEQPSNYTKSGVEVMFRPNDSAFRSANSIIAKSTPFFQQKAYASEADLRRDAHKWETVLHDKKTMRGSSIRNPVFDIHYNARTAGHDGTPSAPLLRYAMVISVESKHTPDLYDEVLRTYVARLEPLEPRINIPMRITTLSSESSDSPPSLF